MARFEPHSLLELLSAAADAPGCGHRLPSLTTLWARAAIHQPTGNSIAGAGHLPKLLRAAWRSAPQLMHLEDCWLADPRLVVSFPIASRRLEIHPGSFTNPIQTLRNITAVAEAIDSFVDERHGFALSDLLEVGLSYADQRVRCLRPAWPTEPLPSEGDVKDEDLKRRVARIAATRVLLTAGELDASKAFDRDPNGWITQCAHMASAAAAWAWATRPANGVELDISPEGQPLGTALAVTTGASTAPVPAALVLYALAAAAGHFAAEAAADGSCRRRIQRVTERRLLTMLGRPVEQAATDEVEDVLIEADAPVDRLMTLVVAGNRHAVAIGTASGLDAERLLEAIAAAEKDVARVDTAFLRRSAEIPFDDTGSIIRVVVYGGPLHRPPPAHRGIVRIHVEDLLEASLEAAETDASTEIGLALLWQFLEELATMPGVGQLLALDFDDIWRQWLVIGVLNPTGLREITVHPSAVPDQRRWRRAASWEPIEGVLSAAGLPPTWEWLSARLDDGPGQATLGVFQDVSLVLAKPPLILSTPIDSSLADIGLDPAFGVGIADGVRLTVAGSEDVAAGLSMLDESPLICRVRLTTDRLSNSHANEIGIGFATTREPGPIIELLIGTDWLELLGDDPILAHAILGEALAASLERLSEAPIPDRDAFLIAWKAAPPVALLRSIEGSLVHRHPGSHDLPRSVASHGRARRTLAACAMKRRIPTGRHVGHDAAAFAREQIVPALEDALSQATADWAPRAVMTVANHLNDAHAERARVERELELALTTPWGAHWQEVALERPNEAERTRPLELLLELLMTKPLEGHVHPDQFDVADATDVAHEALRIGLALSGARTKLHDLAINVADGGLVDVMPIIPPSRNAVGRRSIDLAAYLQAAREHQLALNPKDLGVGTDRAPLSLSEASSWQAESFRRLREFDVPGSLLKADVILRETCGTGIDGLNAVLGTAVTWTEGGDEVTVARRDGLCAEAIRWSQLPQTEVEAAMGYLTLDPADLQREGIRYWEQERRRYRLATRPLVLLQNEDLLMIPWRIRATQQVYVNYMLDGRLPWHSSELPPSVRDAFNEFRQVGNKGLEREAARVVDECGLPYLQNLEQHVSAYAGLELPGELDLLVADPQHERLWVCEVKDISLAVSPSTIAARVRKFLDADGYVDQLLGLTEAVRTRPSAAIQLLGLAPAVREWDVTPLMVTRRVEPAAFAHELPVSFITLTGLATFLSAEK